MAILVISMIEQKWCPGFKMGLELGHHFCSIIINMFDVIY